MRNRIQRDKRPDFPPHPGYRLLPLIGKLPNETLKELKRTSRFPHANRCTRHHVHVTSCGPTGAMAESLPRRVSMPPWAGHLRPPTPAWARGSVPLPEDGCDKTPATSPGQAAEKPEPWPLLVGAENGAAAVEDKSAVP